MQLIPHDWIERIHEELEAIHERMAAQPVPGVHIAWETFDDPGRPKRIKQSMHSELVSPTLNRVLRCAGEA